MNKSDKVSEYVRRSRAEFVEEQAQTESFKYKIIHSYNKISSYFSNLFQKCRRIVNIFSEAFRKFLKQINFGKAFQDFIVWFFEVLIEGLIINFALHYIFGLKFSPFTILAYGIIIYEIISIVQRLKERNGPTKQIFDSESN